MSMTKKAQFLAGVIYFIGLLLGIEMGGLQFVILKIADEFSLSQAAMGSIVSIEFIAMMVAALFIGILSDRIGKKKVIVVFSAVFAGSALLCAMAGTVTVLNAGVCGIGIAFGALEGAVTAALSDAYAEKSAKHVAMMQGFLGLGAVLSPLAVDCAMDMGASWRFLFWFCAAFAATATILTLFAQFKRCQKTESKETQKFILKEAILLSALAGIFCYQFMENGITSFVDSFFVNVIHERGVSAMSLSIFWAAMALSRILFSLLYQYRNRIIPFVCLFASLFLFGLRFAGSPMAAIILIGVLGICYGPISPYLMNFAVEHYPHMSGAAAGIMLACSGIGGSVSPILIGLISDSVGLRVAFIVVGVMAFAECVLVIKGISASRKLNDNCKTQ